MKNIIRQLRMEKSMTVTELAETVGCNPMSIYRYETGHRIPDVDVAMKIANALGVTVDELMGKKAG